jgi:hypothetical protein
MLVKTQLAETVQRYATPLHDRADAAREEMCPQRVTLVAADFEVLENVEPVRRFTGRRRQAERADMTERSIVTRGDSPPARHRFVVPAEFVGEQRRLDVIQPRIGAPLVAIGADHLVGAGTVVAHGAHAPGEIAIAGHQHAGIAKRAQCLGGIEAEGAPNPKIAGGAAIQSRPERLRGVLEHRYRVMAGNV